MSLSVGSLGENFLSQFFSSCSWWIRVSSYHQSRAHYKVKALSLILEVPLDYVSFSSLLASAWSKDQATAKHWTPPLPNHWLNDPLAGKRSRGTKTWAYRATWVFSHTDEVREVSGFNFKNYGNGETRLHQKFSDRAYLYSSPFPSPPYLFLFPKPGYRWVNSRAKGIKPIANTVMMPMFPTLCLAPVRS
jgi:hypothetical protein